MFLVTFILKKLEFKKTPIVEMNYGAFKHYIERSSGILTAICRYIILWADLAMNGLFS